jgi:Peptidase family C25
MVDDFLANGILADTGQPLSLPGEEVFRRLTGMGTPAEERESTEKRAREGQTFGLNVDLDPRELSQAGWGIVFTAGADTTPIEQALAPLIERRRAQASKQDENLFKIFKGDDGVKPGESVTQWLGRQGVSGVRLEAVNPRAGVPYYLMLVGSPEELPMSFQYTLDIFWAVGRLHFPTIPEYAFYADSLVAYETADLPPQHRKLAALFATEHPFDAATKMFTAGVAVPLLNGDAANTPLGKNQRFRVEPMLGSEATKDKLATLLRGKRDGGTPAVLLSGSHGMVFSSEDKRLPQCQGALVCQDWAGFGQITEGDWFSASDLPADAAIHGMIHFLFACYGGGWEKFDTFRTGPNGTAVQIADTASLSRLPQAMLAHPKGGALAVLSHIDRAWSYSFTTDQHRPQCDGIRDVLTGILMGLPIGHATDQFNVRWSAISAELADALRDMKEGKIPGIDLARKWLMRDDARNYSIIGDPAVRLRKDEMVDGI